MLRVIRPSVIRVRNRAARQLQFVNFRGFVGPERNNIIRGLRVKRFVSSAVMNFIELLQYLLTSDGVVHVLPNTASII